MGVRREGRIVVIDDERGGDQRIVALERGSASALVLYGTRGEQTRGAFDSDWRISCVRVAEEHVPAAASVLLGMALAGVSLEEALASFFSDGRAEFSDLLDLMDAAGVPYAYACADESGVVSREQARPLAGPK